ncbi:MAG TPA: asparagine synthase (glutamine-hydrolyzing) [Phycisphaerae bacterium]|nr:asparagine synthase (glutamine-hydrolyzing) [Phycisphaerae bacterium]HPS52504.1 asparagine synthase (glutamine-hydrolyzing) [Phycisphaerae bacterium]
MCGFAGEFVFKGQADLAVVERMAATLNHRGPDGSGHYTSVDGQCAMAFRRLAVIDPENSGQPMTDSTGRYVLAFNGEIYNFRKLRSELQHDGIIFRTDGDTEVFLQMLIKYGTGCAEKLRGMFAAVFYDSIEKKLSFLRDRMGQKPLFYAALPDRIIFASELKALQKHPKINVNYNASFITSYLTIGYIPSPNTPFSTVKKFPPACRAEISASENFSTFSIFLKYYSAGENPSALPENSNELAGFVREKIINAVGERLVADVPLGLLLSGGIDSAVVLAAMCEHLSATSIKTFTAGFENAAYDERPDAAALAKFFGTDHHELKISPAPEKMLDWVIDTYDEPFADSSAWPTYHICRAARKYITVALAGDGGDEVFGGYDRYRAMYISQHIKPFQYLALRLAGAAVNFIAPYNERNRLRRFARFTEILPYPFSVQYFMCRRLFGPADLLKLLNQDFLASNEIFVDEPAEWFYDLFEQGKSLSHAVNAQYHDVATYLPDDLLVKADRASMAASLELRSPMLDYELVDIGLALPVSEKLNCRRGKLILQKAFSDVLPKNLFRRQKRGFAVPLADWLRNGLKEEMLLTLTDKAFLDLKIFNSAAIAGLVNEHVSGQADHSHRLWALLVLAKWLIKPQS